ncbi:glycosyltransferase family 39 protein [Rhizobium sp. BK376]|uniref:glycosyltransferase family 39 protein n=1 Tax=Rhizobium sp. BK376 TaxID=2512149 RepID=UPI00104E37D5|nr:glycosyltransferase family 39 protein [Rhizobium sp. BK376]TCR93123.1 dolichyl-phosphate-mannose-protein mannosyltransferase [Rhizobium sp. BK376]
MHKLLVRRPDAVILLIAGYFVLEFLTRMAMPHSMRYDESQQVFFSQWLTLGYDSQPPLYNWLQTLFISMFGLSLAAISIVKNIVLFLIYLTYYKLARLVLSDKVFAVIATLSLLTIPQFFWEAQRDLTHTVAQLLTINLFLYGIIRTLKAPSLTTYLFMGAALGLGMLSKYNFALLAAAALVAVWMHPQGRARLFDKRFLLTVVVAVLIFLPHGLWLVHNLGLASGRTLGIMEQDAPKDGIIKIIQGPLEFIELVAVICAPTLVFYSLVFGKTLFGNLRQTDEWTRFFETLLLVIGLLVLVLILGIGMTALRDRWLLPFLFLLPIYLCRKMEIAGVRGEDFAKRFVYIPLAMMLIIPTLLLTRVTFPGLFKSYEAYNVPYAAFMQQVVTEEGKKPGLVLTDDWLPAGNLRLQVPDVPVMSMFFSNLKIGYQWTADKPILLAWLPKKGADDMPATLTAWLHDTLGPDYAAPAVKQAQVPYIHGRDGDTYRFYYSWVYPK